MRRVTLSGHVVELFDAIDGLPMRRFHKYNKMVLVDAGIGSDLSALDAHLEKAAMFIKNKTPELAQTELDNLRQCVYFIHTGVSPRSLAFAVLVKSIDGKAYDDLSDKSLQEVCDMLSEVSVSETAALFEAVKKKIDDELRAYFPQMFDDAQSKEYYDDLRRHTLAVLDTIINGESDERKAVIERLSLALLRYSKPQSFSGKDNAEIAYDKQFEKMCLTLSRELNCNAKNFTVMEYYTAFEYLKEKTKKAKKNGR